MTSPPDAAPTSPDPEHLDWVWLEPIERGDPDFFAGFPSTTNERLRREGPRWCLTRGYYVVDWIETNCVYSDGRWVGQPVKLLPWEERLLVELFEVHADSLLRVFRWALVGLPKKNGKTELAAWLGLYMLDGDDEPAPFIVCSAASDEQADLVFGAASAVVEMSPSLRQVMMAEARRITHRVYQRARLQRVAAAAGTNDGKHIHCVICDELHEWAPGKHERVWTILTNGLGAREQPLVVQITTAGTDEDTVCKRQYELYVDVFEGVKEDATFYGVWFQAPDEDPDTGEPLDYRTERAVALSNPSYGETVVWSFFEDQLNKKREADYRRYFLNQWTESEEIWEGAQLWDACAGEPTLDEGQPLYVGVDIAIRHDATAVVCAQWSEERQRVEVWQRIWENPFGRNDARHATWELDFEEVEAVLRQLRERFPEPAREDEEENLVVGPAFFYDPMFMERTAQVLRRDHGLNMLEYPQSNLRMVEASQRLFELVKRVQVEHDGDKLARRHVRSTGVKETDRGWRLTRAGAGRRPNDFTIACAIAVLEATRDVDLAGYDEAPNLYVGEDTRPPVQTTTGQVVRRAPVGPVEGQLTYRLVYADGTEELVYAPNKNLAVEAARGVADGKRVVRFELVG